MCVSMSLTVSQRVYSQSHSVTCTSNMTERATLQSRLERDLVGDDVMRARRTTGWQWMVQDVGRWWRTLPYSCYAASTQHVNFDGKKTPQSPWRWSQRCSYITMTQQLRRKRTPERCRWASVAYWDSQPSQYCTVYYDRKRLRPSVLCYIYCSPTLTVINSHECANGLILCALQWSSVFRCKNRNFEQQQYTRLHAIRRTNYVVRRRLSAVA